MKDAKDRRAILDLVVRINDVQRGTASRLRHPDWTYSIEKGQNLGVPEWESIRARLVEVNRLAYEAITHVDQLIIDTEEGRR